MQKYNLYSIYPTLFPYFFDTFPKETLELRKRLQGCTLFFFVSISYGHLTNEVTTISDKMQTKIAKKRPGTGVPGLEIFIQ